MEPVTSSNSMLHRLIIGALLVTVSKPYAQTSPDDFPGEPDKTMAVARESFLKGDLNKASAEIQKAALFVKKSSEQVAADCKMGLEVAARELEKLGENVRKGVAKFDAELKNAFARTDYALATGWHRTAEQSGKADRAEALKKAGSALLGAAKWSANKPDEANESPLNAFDETDQTVGVDSKGAADIR